MTAGELLAAGVQSQICHSESWMRATGLAAACVLCTMFSGPCHEFRTQVSGTDKEVLDAKQGRQHPGIQKQFLVLRLQERVKFHLQLFSWVSFLQGGKTCTESPQRITRSFAQMLQLRAEKLNGRERMMLIQSSGN